MPKKKKKSKSRKKTSKRKKVKKRKKILKRKKKIKSKIKKVKINNEGSTQELIFKPKPEWVKSGLINKSQYQNKYCLLYTSPSPRDLSTSRMPSSA